MEEPDHDLAFGNITDVIYDPDQPEVSGAAMSATAVTGLLNLSMLLARRAAKESGATTEAEIKAKSSEILRELALQLATSD